MNVCAVVLGPHAHAAAQPEALAHQGAGADAGLAAEGGLQDAACAQSDGAAAADVAGQTHAHIQLTEGAALVEGLDPALLQAALPVQGPGAALPAHAHAKSQFSP